MNKLFNRGLYKEGLKQLSLTGIIFSIILMMPAIISPISTIVLRSADGDVAARGVISNIVEFNPLYVLTFVLFVPLMTLSLFSFLNKRNRSDFYHSLPHKRETVFFSYTMSILTWVLGAILVSTLTTMVISMFGSKYIQLTYSGIFISLFAVVSACVLVLGAVLLAMSITGTYFSNIVTALLIIFLPRTIITTFVSAISSKALVTTSDSFGILGNRTVNIPFSFVTELFDGNVSTIFEKVPAAIYTLIIGVIFIVLACIAFKVRKSEMAGTSAPNRKIQMITRIALSFAVCIIACFEIVKIDVLESASDTIAIIAIYLVAIIVYIAYEIIATKKVKGIQKTLPGLLVVLALNIIFIAGALFCSNVILYTDIETKDVSSIYLESNRDTHYGYQSDPTYEELLIANTNIESEEIKEQMTSSLKVMQDKVITDRDSITRNIYSMYDYAVKFKMKNGKTYYRRILMGEAEYNALQDMISDEDEYRSIHTNLPEDPSNLFLLSSSPVDISGEDTRKIYESLREEVKEIDFKKWMFVNGSAGSDAYREEIQKTAPELTSGNAMQISIIARGTRDFDKYDSTYVISSATPKTLSLALGIIRNNDEEKFEKFLDDYKAGEFSNIEGERFIDFSLNYNPNSKSPQDVIHSIFYSYHFEPIEKITRETIDEMISMIIEEFPNQKGKELDVTKPTITIGTRVYDSAGYSEDSSYTTYTMNVSDKLSKFISDNADILGNMQMYGETAIIYG